MNLSADYVMKENRKSVQEFIGTFSMIPFQSKKCVEELQNTKDKQNKIVYRIRKVEKNELFSKHKIYGMRAKLTEWEHKSHSSSKNNLNPTTLVGGQGEIYGENFPKLLEELKNLREVNDYLFDSETESMKMSEKNKDLRQELEGLKLEREGYERILRSNNQEIELLKNSF